MKTISLAVFSERVLSFLRFCEFFFSFPVPEPSKQAGDLFKCIGDVFCIEFAYGNAQNHLKIMKIRTFGDFTILGVLLPALRGKYIFEKRTQNEKLKKYQVFKQPNYS